MKVLIYILMVFLLFNIFGWIFNVGAVNQIDDHTAREEAEGKAVWEKLQAEELTCKDLSDDNFGTLGEYFMGQMTGDSHEAMNNMMIRMMGEKGEEQMHVVMGKRLSGCDTSAVFPSQGVGFMPMMNMMMGGWPARNVSQSEAGGSSPTGLNQGNPEGRQDSYGAGNSMTNFGFMPFGGFSWIFMIIFWILVIIGVVSLIYWLLSQTKPENKSALDILKERYAKGEINKKEFEERKKDLI